jgi:tetratricopeptide (TPR) repeat protein
LHDAQRFEEAVHIYDRYLEGPEDEWTAAVFANKANSLVAIGRLAEARALYETAIAREPDRATHYQNYVRLLVRGREWGRAIETIDEALAHVAGAEDRARLLEDRSYVFAEQDKGEEALAAAREALALAPRRTRARYLYGRGLGLVGRLEEAREEMARVLEQDPENADARRAIGLLDEALGGTGG